MIDEEKTLIDFGYTSDTLSIGNSTRVWVTCPICKNQRTVRYSMYISYNKKPLVCGSCAHLIQRGPFNIEYFHAIYDSVYNTNIDELYTFEMFGYYSIDLIKTSRKHIYVSCDSCGYYRSIGYNMYSRTSGMCGPCTAKLKTTRKRASKQVSGENNPMFGKTHNILTLKKMSIANSNLSDATRKKMSIANAKGNNPMYGKTHTEESRRKMSATRQGIAYEEWKSFATNSLYCPKFNEAIKEYIRNKYGRRCFLCDKPEKENITSTGKMRKLSVHHVDMNKNQGCDEHEWKLVPFCMWCHNSKIAFIMQQYIEYILENE